MKDTMVALALLSTLALPAVAQDATPWNDLSVGDRVEVTFHSGNTLNGTLVAPDPKFKTIDYAKESVLTLDVSWEYPGVNGTMTVPRKEVKSVRRLRTLDEKTRRRLEEVKKQMAEDAAREAQAKADAPPPPPKPQAKPKPDPAAEEAARKEAEERAKREAEELQRAKDFYAKYPPPYWGPERHTMNIQKKARGQAFTLAEAEFEQGYPGVWDRGRAASAPPAEPKKN